MNDKTDYKEEGHFWKLVRRKIISGMRTLLINDPDERIRVVPERQFIGTSSWDTFWIDWDSRHKIDRKHSAIVISR
jgi:hypothetical protein